MFTHKVVGNTLYIKRPKEDIYRGKPLWIGPLFITLLLAVLLPTTTKDVGIKEYMWWVIAALATIAAAWYEYNFVERNATIKITKPAEGNMVIVNNKVIDNPRYLFNPAELISSTSYAIYLQQYNGDGHTIVNYILDKKDMYAMMELIAEHLGIPLLKDN